jgi:hypothetical protein
MTKNLLHQEKQDDLRKVKQPKNYTSRKREKVRIFGMYLIRVPFSASLVSFCYNKIHTIII